MRLLLLLLLLSSSLLVINNLWSPRQRHRQRRLRPVVPVAFVFAIAAAVILDWWVIFLSMKMNMNPSKALVVGRRRFPFFLHVDAWSPSHTTAVTSGSVSRHSSIVLKSTNNNSLLPKACHPAPSSFLKRSSTPFCLKYMSSVAELVEDSSNDNNDTEDDLDSSSSLSSSSSSSYHTGTTPTTTKKKKMMFQLTTPYEPTGDQPQAIDTLVNQIERGDKYSVLRGITGSGKSFVMANTIARVRTLNMITVEKENLCSDDLPCSFVAYKQVIALLLRFSYDDRLIDRH